MDIKEVASAWNAAVQLRRPDVKAIKSVLRVRDTQRVFRQVPDLVYLRNNLLLKLRPGDALVDSTPALSMTMVLCASFFSGEALISTEDVPRFHVLGLEVPCVALSMLNHLSRIDPRGVSASTESDRWTVFYGNALSFLFLPLGGSGTSDPGKSKMVAMEYFFGEEYAGVQPPLVVV